MPAFTGGDCTTTAGSVALSCQFQSIGTGALLYSAYTRLYAMSSEITDFCTLAQIATDMTSCAQAAINAAAATATASQGGRVIHMPAYVGAYNLAGTLSITSSFVTLAGDGRQATRILCANGSADCAIIGQTGAGQIRGSGLRDLSIWGSGKTGGAGVHVVNAYDTALDNISVEAAINGIDVDQDTNTTRLRHVLVTLATGSTGVGLRYHAVSGHRSDVLSIYDVTIEGNWTMSTGFVWDGPAFTVTGSGLRLLHGQYGLQVLNTAGSSVDYPQFMNMHDLEAEGFTKRALDIESGSDIKIASSDINNMTNSGHGTTDDYAIACMQDAGGDHAQTRGIQIVNSRIGNSQRSGVYATCRNLQLTGNIFFSTSQAGLNAAPVIHLANGADRIIINGNTCEELGGAAQASYCITDDVGVTNVQVGVNDYTAMNSGYINDVGGAIAIARQAEFNRWASTLPVYSGSGAAPVPTGQFFNNGGLPMIAQ